MSKDLTSIMADWPADSGGIRSRKITVEGQSFIQLRIDLGVLQMAMDGRPDGDRPYGFETALAWLEKQSKQQGDAFELTDDQQVELTREMLQFYRRRISLMALAKQAQTDDNLEEADDLYRRAIRDAEHNIAILDLMAAADAEVLEEHEQYRPFILMHRATCRAERALLIHDPDQAIEDLKHGIFEIDQCSEDIDDPDEEDSVMTPEHFIAELRRFERHIRKLYRRQRTLPEQLQDAISAERFEQAARIRDALADRSRARR